MPYNKNLLESSPGIVTSEHISPIPSINSQSPFSVCVGIVPKVNKPMI